VPASAARDVPVVRRAAHRVCGWATGTVLPPVSHVAGRLWIGGCRDGAPLPGRFDHVVSLCPRARWLLPPGVDRVELDLRDRWVLPDPAVLHGVAQVVLDRASSGRTLVHCRLGLNRSALVVGLALVSAGMGADDAIVLLRTARGRAVLSNPAFAGWLRTEAGPDVGLAVA
jgi:hypothetical protein